MAEKKTSGRKTTGRPPKNGNGASSADSDMKRRAAPAGSQELIIVAKPDAGLRVTPQGMASVTGQDVTPLANLLSSEAISIAPLFGISEDRMEERAARMTAASPEDTHLSQYYWVQAPEEQLEHLCDELLQNPSDDHRVV